MALHWYFTPANRRRRSPRGKHTSRIYEFRIQIRGRCWLPENDWIPFGFPLKQPQNPHPPFASVETKKETSESLPKTNRTTKQKEKRIQRELPRKNNKKPKTEANKKAEWQLAHSPLRLARTRSERDLLPLHKKTEEKLSGSLPLRPDSTRARRSFPRLRWRRCPPCSGGTGSARWPRSTRMPPLRAPPGAGPTWFENVPRKRGKSTLLFLGVRQFPMLSTYIFLWGAEIPYRHPEHVPMFPPFAGLTL